MDFALLQFQLKISHFLKVWIHVIAQVRFNLIQLPPDLYHFKNKDQSIQVTSHLILTKSLAKESSLYLISTPTESSIF